MHFLRGTRTVNPQAEILSWRLPWWSSGYDFALPMQEAGFHLWSGNEIPPASTKDPARCNKDWRSHGSQLIPSQINQSFLKKEIFSWRLNKWRSDSPLVLGVKMKWRDSRKGMVPPSPGLQSRIQIQSPKPSWTAVFGLSRWFSGKRNHLPMQEMWWVQSLGQEDPLEKEMATHSSILAWKIPWTEEAGGLQFMGSQKNQTWLSDQTTKTGMRSKHAVGVLLLLPEALRWCWSSLRHKFLIREAFV